MQVSLEKLQPTKFKLTVSADQQLLDETKRHVLQRLGRQLKLQGFRPGKAPLELVEKSLDSNQLQTEFLEQAVNQLYVAAIEQQRLRPVAQPEVNVTKFVPFTTLEMTAEVEAVGEVKLPDYKQIKLTAAPVKVTAKDVNDVLDNLKLRAASRQPVERASKDGDEVWIDFTGVDAKSREAIKGADGQDYPLVLGSNTFIPGFEPNLVGLKAGDTKEFTLTFPKDYGVKALQNRQVAFTVTLKKVQAISEPTLNAEFAATIGPFKSMDELKADIKRQLEAEKRAESDRAYDNELIEKIAAKTKADIPQALIDEEIDRLEQQERQNTAYRGQTWQEHLEEEGVTEAEHREKNRPGAELRVKAGLILGEVAEAEGLKVTPEELEIRLQLLKGQYQDAAMQAELDKPENVREIASRLLTEKTLDRLKHYASS